MGLFDKVKKILFDEEEIDDLPVRNDKEEKSEQPAKYSRTEPIMQTRVKEEKGGVIIHNDEDTITEVKVPVEEPRSFAFPMMMDEDDEPVQELPKRESVHPEAHQEVTREVVHQEVRQEVPQDTQRLRLKEDEFDRTKEIERLREQQMTKSREDLINEYNENKRLQRERLEQRREVTTTTVEKKERVPYKVPPVISPVFGILDKNYDPDTYEESRQKIILTNAGNTKAINERQFGPVSFNDQGIPTPKYQSQTVIIATTSNPRDLIKAELKKESEAAKVAAKIEDEIINSIINDTIESPSTVEDAFDDTKEITKPIPKIKKEKEVKVEIEEPEIDYSFDKEEEDEDAVITGSPYDNLFEDEQEEEIKPTKDINDLIEEQDAEEANITPKAPKNIEDNADLDDTIETDLYNLIDSMYKDED